MLAHWEEARAATCRRTGAGRLCLRDVEEASVSQGRGLVVSEAAWVLRVRLVGEEALCLGLWWVWREDVRTRGQR